MSAKPVSFVGHCQESARRYAKYFRRTAPKEDLLRPYLVERRDLLRDFVVLPEGIPVHLASCGTNGVSHFGRRAIGILVAVQEDEPVWPFGPAGLTSVRCRNIPKGPDRAAPAAAPTPKARRKPLRDLIMHISFDASRIAADETRASYAKTSACRKQFTTVTSE
jgi:hypothetical protein